MSTAMGSPTRNTPMGFDGSNMYGSDFVLDISHKMRIPDKISVAPGSNEKMKPANVGMDRLADNVHLFDDYQWMHVPERIFVVGNDQHISGRDMLPEMKLETSIMENLKSDTNMPTPQKLTVEHPFPAVGAERDVQVSSDGYSVQKKTASRSMSAAFDDDFYNSFDHGSPPYDSNLNASNYSVSGNVNEIVLLRKQMKMLNRRLTALERENHQRHQREIVMYSVGVLYFLLKGVFWLRRQW